MIGGTSDCDAAHTRYLIEYQQLPGRIRGRQTGRSEGETTPQSIDKGAPCAVQRIAPPHLFDVSVRDDNLFHSDKYKWSLQLTAVNFTNRAAFHNFFSAFCGTRYVTRRPLTAQVRFNFYKFFPEPGRVTARCGDTLSR